MRHEALLEEVSGVFRVNEPDAEHGDCGYSVKFFGQWVSIGRSRLRPWQVRMELIWEPAARRDR